MSDKVLKKEKKIRRLAVLTGGGDAQGMNAALRAVSRTALRSGWKVYGIKDGFYGLYRLSKSRKPLSRAGGKLPIVEEMSWEYMSWAVRDGGSLLGTIRFERLKKEPGIAIEIVRKLTDPQNLKSKTGYGLGVKALIVIGGNGSLMGAYTLSWAARKLKRNLSIIVIPASIDNDIPKTEISLGVDSALNIIVSSIDRLVDTTSAVNRAIVVETMGRDCGHLAIMGALASGAQEVFCQERPPDDAKLKELLDNLTKQLAAGRRSAVIVVGEGATKGKLKTGSHIVDSITLHTMSHPELKGEEIPWDARKCELGHLQRGGPTSAFDRILATRMGAQAVRLLNKHSGKNIQMMVNLDGGDIGSIKLPDVVKAIGKKDDNEIQEMHNYANLVHQLSELKTPDPRNEYLVIVAGGPDSPGMNTAIRAVSQYALNKFNLNSLGAINGFEGLINNNLETIDWNGLRKAGIPARRAGCFLGANRWPMTLSDEDKGRILENLQKPYRGKIRGLVFIGNLGTALHAMELHEFFRKKKFNISIVYIPASIDHGLPSTHATLGFDTALNVVVQSCDKIADTAQASDRVFVVDTMGGGVGALTMMSALAAGAECAITAEEFGNGTMESTESSPIDEATECLKKLDRAMKSCEKKYATVLIQSRQLKNFDINRLLGRADVIFNPREVRKVELGHTQRGGNASYYDRLLATLMAVRAVEVIKAGRKSKAKLLAQRKRSIVEMDLAEALGHSKTEDSWSESNRMEKAKQLWRYEEIKELFHFISNDNPKE